VLYICRQAGFVLELFLPDWRRSGGVLFFQEKSTQTIIIKSRKEKPEHVISTLRYFPNRLVSPPTTNKKDRIIAAPFLLSYFAFTFLWI
jgi:hypothetical protein